MICWKIQLDISAFEEKVSVHRYLKEQLGFPFYYGANLDALYDLISYLVLRNPCISR